jgi:uncharacterized protein (DUF2126 family)
MRDLADGDVRLTMGGEPTFVSIDDDPDGAEWNTAALGPTKRKLADDSDHRLREKFAPGGLRISAGQVVSGRAAAALVAELLLAHRR